jgi:uncharacterized protein YbjT (DUF2867 family)
MYSQDETRRTILVAGATGKQGSALIRALLALNSRASARDDDSPETPFHIYALTRKADTARAQQWAGEAAVTVVEGDLDRPASISQIFQDAKAGGDGGGIWGVFAVLAFPGLGAAADGEERQGKVRIEESWCR